MTSSRAPSSCLMICVLALQSIGGVSVVHGERVPSTPAAALFADQALIQKIAQAWAVSPAHHVRLLREQSQAKREELARIQKTVTDLAEFAHQVNRPLQDAMTRLYPKTYPHVCSVVSAAAQMLFMTRHGEDIHMRRMHGFKGSWSSSDDHWWLEIRVGHRLFFSSYSEGQFFLTPDLWLLLMTRPFEEFLEAYQNGGLDFPVFQEIVGPPKKFYEALKLFHVREETRPVPLSGELVLRLSEALRSIESSVVVPFSENIFRLKEPSEGGSDRMTASRVATGGVLFLAAWLASAALVQAQAPRSVTGPTYSFSYSGLDREVNEIRFFVLTPEEEQAFTLNLLDKSLRTVRTPKTTHPAEKRLEVTQIFTATENPMAYTAGLHQLDSLMADAQAQARDRGGPSATLDDEYAQMREMLLSAAVDRPAGTAVKPPMGIAKDGPFAQAFFAEQGYTNVLKISREPEDAAFIMEFGSSGRLNSGGHTVEFGNADEHLVIEWDVKKQHLVIQRPAQTARLAKGDPAYWEGLRQFLAYAERGLERADADHQQAFEYVISLLEAALENAPQAALSPAGLLSRPSRVLRIAA